MEATAQRWLFGPATDLLLGCGLGYLAILAVFVASGTEQAAVGALGIIPLISIFTGTPHYGATLLRVYAKREDRRAYAFFAVWLTIFIWGAFYAGLYNRVLGSFLLTLYLSWSPWHYTGQNYGIAVMFLRRRGVAFSPTTKRIFYASFLLSYVLTLLALHGSQGGGEYASVQPYGGSSIHLMRLGIPSPYWESAFAVIGLAYLATLATAGARLLRGGRPRELAPVALLALTQMAWFALPAAARHWGILGSDGMLDSTLTAYAFFWVATGHSVQYLWITLYYAARNGSRADRLRYLGKMLAAGSFIWGVPGLLYSLTLEGGRFGGIARGQDVFVLLASAVNLHHFVLDGAIWKLRDGRVARILVQRAPPGERPAPIEPDRRRRWLAPAVYTVGVLATLQVLGSWGERQLRLEPALTSGDIAAAGRSIGRLEAIRADSAEDHLRFGRLAVFQNNQRLALHQYGLSLEKQPTPEVWLALGKLAERNGNTDRAIAAYEQAIVLNPNMPQALFDLGSAWLKLGEPARALSPLERAVELLPDDDLLRATLERARRRSAEAPSGAT